VITHKYVEAHLCRVFSHRRGAEGAESSVFSSGLCVLCASAVQELRSCGIEHHRDTEDTEFL